MFLIRSFLFSITVLFLALMATPFVVIIWFVFFILGIVLSYLLALISPVLALVVLIGFGVASYSVVSTMVCTRFALQTKGIGPRNSYTALMGNSVGYGLVEAMLQFMAYAVAALLFSAVSGIDVRRLFAALDSGYDTAIDQIVLDNTGAVSIAMILGGLLIATIRAIMLLPLAASSVGRDPGGHLHTPFWGMGKHFFALFFVVLMSLVPLALIRVFSDEIAMLFGYAGGFSEMVEPAFRRSNASWWETITPGMMIGWGIAWIVYTWLLSIQAAGATLIYVDLDRVRAAPPSRDRAMAGIGAPPVRQTNAAQLWRDRM